MATTKEIQISVVEEEVGTKSPTSHLVRAPILSIENKTDYAYHDTSGVDQSAIQAMINAFKSTPNSLKFEIGWKPSRDNSSLFNNLKSIAKTKTLSITIYWFIRDSNTLVYSRSVVIKSGKVN